MPDDQPIADEQPQGHRAGAWVVLLMGLVGLGLGVYQWHGSFAAAFGKPNASFKTPDEIEADRIAALKTKDTDADGLTDFDETYIYKTSPYLKDSDSDGIDDKTEVTQGDDPNCPKGRQCGTDLTASAGGAAYSASGTDLGPAANPAADPTADPSALVQQEVADQLLNPTPEQVRTMLVQAGMKKEDLQNIDDKTLLDLYQQSLHEVQDSTASATGSP